MNIREIENLIVEKLQQNFSDFQVIGFPEKPQEYILLHPIGAILVHYRGGSYSSTNSINFLSQDKKMEFGVTVVTRNLRSNSGSYETLDKIKNVLSVADVTKADIIGGVDSVTGKRKGLQTFKDCYSLFGYFPKTIIAPVYCEDTAVVSEMQVICDKIRAIGIVDAPVGTTVQDVIKGRGPQGTINFNTSSDRIVLCYPHLKVYDSSSDSNVLEPYSQRLAGVMAAKDVDKGYHWSPSNTEIKGIIGVEKQLTSMINDPTSEVNTLNEAGIVTVFNSYGTGFKTWGNRSAAYPTSTNVTNFINIRRTADILHESVEYSMLQFIDYPIDNGLIESITETVNSFIRTLIGRGALIDGKCTYNADKNPVTEIANGHILFDVEFMPPVPAERITFESFIDIELLKSLGA